MALLNASALYYESAQSQAAFAALTDSGDYTIFTLANKPWSQAAGYEAAITPYGLATGLFTNRLDDAFKAARRLEVGGVHINETSSSRVDVMPYGGSKDSGFGREGPHYAVREMSEERMVTLLP